MSTFCGAFEQGERVSVRDALTGTVAGYRVTSDGRLQVLVTPDAWPTAMVAATRSDLVREADPADCRRTDVCLSCGYPVTGQDDYLTYVTGQPLPPGYVVHCDGELARFHYWRACGRSCPTCHPS